MKNKILMIFLFIIFAIPIPIVILGFLFSFIMIVGVIICRLRFVETLSSLCVIASGATYLLGYKYALKKTREDNKITAKTFVPIISGLLAVAFLLLLKPINNYTDITTPYFGFTKKEFSVVAELEDYGGFPADGSHYLILDCSGNKQKALEIIKNWNKLPLSENLNIAMYGGEKDGVIYGYELANEAHMPKIENGYYIFEDRHSESNDGKDDAGLLGRHSFNFSIAVYDCDTDKMYFFKFDT